MGLATEFCREATEFSFQEIRLATTPKGEAGVLVMRESHLVAVLTRIGPDEHHDEHAGEWFLEIGFGRLNGYHKLFGSVEEATRWISDRYEGFAEVTAVSSAG